MKHFFITYFLTFFGVSVCQAEIGLITPTESKRLIDSPDAAQRPLARRMDRGVRRGRARAMDPVVGLGAGAALQRLLQSLLSDCGISLGLECERWRELD